MATTFAAQLKREIGILRDPACGRGQRALAAATISAAFAADDEPVVAAAAPPAVQDGNARMFGYGVRHDHAAAWDGQSTRSGTITFVDDERIEQYVGQQKWIAYDQRDLAAPGFVLGDQVRIGRRAGRLNIEAVAPNRLASQTPPQGVPVRSGLVIFRTLEIDAAEIESTARSAAERYAATIADDAQRVVLTFSGGGQLFFAPAAVPAEITDALVCEPFRAALRLDVCIASNNPDAAYETECALAYCAALIAASGEAIAVDDTGAMLSGEQLYNLAVRDQTRAAAFSIAAAAAQRAWPVRAGWFSDRSGVCDELTLFSSRSWRADFAAAFVERALHALSDAAQRTGDPIAPVGGVMYSGQERGEPGTLQRLVSLAYDTVELDIAFLDAAPAADDAGSRLGTREDIAALLGAPVQSAMVIAYGNRSSDVDSDQFMREMQCADALATALGASFARLADCVAGDAGGALYSADELVELALQRRGKAASWTARVAAARDALPRFDSDRADGSVMSSSPSS